MNPVIFISEAEEELFQSASYYERKVKNLGRDFLKEIEYSLEAIHNFPKAAPVIRYSIRRRLVRRFPFGILYRIDSTEILVIAVMHLRRRPNHWISRRKKAS